MQKLPLEEQDRLERQLLISDPKGTLLTQSRLQGILDPAHVLNYWRAKRAFVTQDPDTLALKERAIKLASVDKPVLILGESGTGKELIARIVHGERNGDFVAVNVCAITDSLFESELFGHVRGSFTGADKDRDGLIRQADGGTLFLDEIGDMSLQIQSKLLRVIESRVYRKVGSNVNLEMKCRIVAATHRNIPEMVREKTFRLDLYERLQVFKLRIKPLRDRLGDVALYGCGPLLGMVFEKLGPATRLVFSGNVRQLMNLKERYDVFGADEITPEDIL